MARNVGIEDSGGLDGAQVTLDDLIRLRHRGAKLLLGARNALQHLTGSSRTSVRGRGMEYAESRTYLPGDEIRNMDWRVTARTGRAHTKLFQEERERPVMLLVDLSPSMFFGTRRAFKSVAAAEAASLLAWAAMAKGDRVGAVVASAGRHRELSPVSGRRGVLRVLGAIADCAQLGEASGAPGESEFPMACRRLRQIARPGSIVCVITDYYCLDEESQAHLTRSCAPGDLLSVWIHDPLEEALPPPGRYPITDGQSRLVLDSAVSELRRTYQSHFASRRESVQTFHARHRARLIELSTANDVETGLRQGLPAAQGVPGGTASGQPA